MDGREASGSVKEEDESRWPDMPLDLLESIVERLPLEDYLTFRSVCRSWHVAPTGCSNIVNFKLGRQWLMFYGRDERSYLYSDSHRECCTIWTPHLQGATCVYSKSGWLLAHRSGCLFFYNPFEQKKIDLPKFRHVKNPRQVYTFSCVPTSADCTVSVVRRINSHSLEIYSCGVGDKKWTVLERKICYREIGTLVFANFCTCRDVRPCNCRDKAKIFIYDDEKKFCFVYKLNEEGGYITLEERGYIEPYPLYSELRSVHQSNWLDRFGGHEEEGILINACPLNISAYSFSGHIPCMYKVTVDGSWRNELKTAWVQPTLTGLDVKSFLG